MSDERLIELLEELVRWTKVTSIPKVKDLLEELLKTPEEKLAYALSDGKRTTREVAEMAKTSQISVSRHWREWIRAGIAEPIAAKGGGNRAKSVFSLDDFGIEVSKANSQISVPNEKSVTDMPHPDDKRQDGETSS